MNGSRGADDGLKNVIGQRRTRGYEGRIPSTASTQAGAGHAHAHAHGCTHTRTRTRARTRAGTVPERTHAHKHTRTRAHAHDCKTNGHNTGCKCQNPRQLHRQTRQGMFNANRRLSKRKKIDSQNTCTRTHAHTYARVGALLLRCHFGDTRRTSSGGLLPWYRSAQTRCDFRNTKSSHALRDTQDPAPQMHRRLGDTPQEGTVAALCCSRSSQRAGH